MNAPRDAEFPIFEPVPYATARLTVSSARREGRAVETLSLD
jgi:hypothetical protein